MPSLPRFVRAVTREEKDALITIARVFRGNAREQCRLDGLHLLVLFEHETLREIPWTMLALGISKGWVLKTKIRHHGGTIKNVYAYTGRHCLPRGKFPKAIRWLKKRLGIETEGPATL